MISSGIMPGAGPFYFEGNDVGILLIHGGGGGTCADLKPLAEDLHRNYNFTIHLPLLPGYGTNPKNLKKTSIDSWKIALKEEINLLQEKCEKLIVGGHSMGGILTLILARKRKFDGIFVISAPVGVRSFLFKLIPFFKLFIKYHKIDSKTFKKDTNDAWVGYDKIPLNIATKIKRLIREMKESLKKIDCPILLFQGCLDSEIKKGSMDYIYNMINSERKRKIWLKNNGHPILNSPDHKRIFSELITFVSEICN
ncbi:MAG: alpha/beta hydrolase [Candidatus Hermodarchaeota archaeon]